MLTRRKGKKKHPRSDAFQNLSTTFKVQLEPATPQTPSNTLGLGFDDDYEISIGGAEWGFQQETFDTSGPSRCAYIDFLVNILSSHEPILWQCGCDELRPR